MAASYEIVDSIQNVSDAISRYEHDTGTKYVEFKQHKRFNQEYADTSIDLRSKGHHVMWQFRLPSPVPFDGVPFIVNGTLIYDCIHGTDRNAKKKEKEEQKRNEKLDHGNFKARRFQLQNTKKRGCKAQIVIKEIFKYPDFKIEMDTEKRRRTASEKLRSSEDPNRIRSFCVFFPAVETHNHKVGEESGIMLPIDKRLITKIDSLVDDGVYSVDEMARALKHFVKTELFPGNECLPNTNNRRYYPRKKTIRNHMYLAIIRRQLASHDQVNVDLKVKQWRQQNRDDKFYYRPRREADTSDSVESNDEIDDEDSDDDDVVKIMTTQPNSLLFIHQTAWQRRLLKRYGNELTLLDATYKTTRYCLPIFFLAVKTNVDYQIVGSFITQDETLQSISEAIGILKLWNADWSPRHFMTDMCKEEINAVLEHFPDCSVLTCDFHREQAWDRWLKSNGCLKDIDVIKSRIRRIARAHTEADFDAAVKDLQNSKEWSDHPKLRKWFSDTWLSEKKRWAWAFRQKRVLVYVRTNNGVESQNKLFKHGYLTNQKRCTLSDMLKTLIEDFLPDRYTKYIDDNSECSSEYKVYNKKIPQFLHNRPSKIVNHCRMRMPTDGNIEFRSVKVVGQGRFKVSLELEEYNVDFGSASAMPSCECEDWKKWFLPCKHMLAIIISQDPGLKDWGWEQLPFFYTNSVFMTIDNDVLFKKVSDFNIDPPHVSTDDNENVDEIPVTPASVASAEMTERQSPKKSVLNRLNSYLIQIRDLAYEMDDGQALIDAESALENVRDNMLSKSNVENGLVTRRVKKKRKLPAPVRPGHKRRHVPLPVRGKFKHPFTGRFGEYASIMRKNYRVQLDVSEKTKPEPKVSTSLAEVDIVAEKIPTSNTKPPTRPGKFKIVVLQPFTPKISSLAKFQTYTSVLYRIDTFGITLLHLKSLEPILPRGEVIALRSADSQFRQGWLFDEIIDSFLFLLSERHDHLQPIVSTTMVAVSSVATRELNLSNLFKGIDLSKKSLFVVPWNYTGGHWTLIVFDKQRFQLSYLDPAQDNVDIDQSMAAKVGCKTMLKILVKKQVISNDDIEMILTNSPHHSVMRTSDNSNCGVYVCWYVHQLVTGNSISTPLNTFHYRKEIYEVIVGSQTAVTGTT